MITRGRKRAEEESNLSQKRLREKAKRAKDIGKRARGAKSREPAHQGDATGVVVTQTKKGEELTSRKSLKCSKRTQRNSSDNQEKPAREKKRSTADDIEASTKKVKNGREEWEEKNEEVTGGFDYGSKC